jgi:PTS system mannose-specific IIA component
VANVAPETIQRLDVRSALKAKGELMIGIVIITHGGLATEFRAALEHVVGAQDRLETLSIGPEDDIESRRTELISAVRRADIGQGVVILTDMFGGTPSNLAISVMDDTGAEVLAGVNLPMLVRLASVRRDKTLAEAVDLAKEAGRKYISVASQVLSGET